MEPVSPLTARQEFKFKIPPVTNGTLSVVYLVATDAGDGAACSSTGCTPRCCQTDCMSKRCQAVVPAMPPSNSSTTTSHTTRWRLPGRGWVDTGGVRVVMHSPGCWTGCVASAMVPSPMHTTPTVVVHWLAHIATGALQELLTMAESAAGHIGRSAQFH